MKYLVLGANSFYGSNFFKFLKEKGEEVHGTSERIAFITPDWSSLDCVVNFVAKSLVPESWENPEEWLKTNVLDTCALLERIRKDAKLYIHISTPEVYGSNTRWLRERWDFRPTTPYAVSRAAADTMLNAYWRAYKFPVIITRTANIYGQGQQDFRLIPKAFKSIRSGAKFPLHGRGNSIRSFIHVRDACEALYLLSKCGNIGETYHISTTKTHTILEVVKLIANILGKNHENVIEKHPERLGKDHAYLLNSEKIRALGWTDKISLEEGLRDYANRAIISEAGPKISIQA